MKYLIILTLTLAFMVKLVSCTEPKPKAENIGVIWPDTANAWPDTVINLCFPPIPGTGPGWVILSDTFSTPPDSIVTSGVLEWNADTVMGTWHVTDSGLFIISFDSIAIK